MSKEVSTFASDYEEPTALASFQGKAIPILEGDAAERFIRMAEENERKVLETKNKPITADEAKLMLSYKLIMLEYERSILKEMEKEIEELKKIIDLSN